MLGTATSSYADPQPSMGDENSESSVSLESPSPDPINSNQPTEDAVASSEVSETEVEKVGEYQSQDADTEANTPEIAVVQPHEMNGREAVTLYIRSIPVLTFLGDRAPSEPVAQAPPNEEGVSNSEVKVGSLQTVSTAPTSTAEKRPEDVQVTAAAEEPDDPMERASEVAAEVNQLHQNAIDPATINVRWDADSATYIIHSNDEELVRISSETVLPDTTGDLAEDALQATNRLRRLLGNASPLSAIEGRPQPTREVSLGPVQFQVSGMASWYGPGFDGRRSASGEVFDQDAMTAAHRTLPFGTMVRVTNANTGLSVVVRINDRGPHTRGRVIDLSTAAARSIGLISAGVAPVNLEVLGTTTASASQEGM